MSCQLVKYRLRVLSLGLRHGQCDEHGSHQRNQSEEQVGERTVHVGEGFGDDEPQQPAEGGGEPAGDALLFGRKQLAHYHPRYRPEAEGKHDDEQRDDGQREELDVRDVEAMNGHVEVPAEDEQTERHYRVGQNKQEPSAGALYQ